MWKGSKKTYRKRYYENEPNFYSVEAKFGSEVATMIEKDHSSVKHIKKYSEPEHKFIVEMGGVEVIGFLDSFDPETNSFLEYKTRRDNAKKQWDQKRVDKHKQLDFYSLKCSYANLLILPSSKKIDLNNCRAEVDALLQPRYWRDNGQLITVECSSCI
jgi:hypothetical protein